MENKDDIIAGLKDENEKMRLMLVEAVINAQSVVHNMQDQIKRHNGIGFCVLDEADFAERVSAFLVNRQVNADGYAIDEKKQPPKHLQFYEWENRRPAGVLGIACPPEYSISVTKGPAGAPKQLPLARLKTEGAVYFDCHEDQSSYELCCRIWRNRMETVEFKFSLGQSVKILATDHVGVVQGAMQSWCRTTSVPFDLLA